jgi:RecA-family ATPase
VSKLVFTPLEAFVRVKEENAEALATAPDGGSVIPANGTLLFYGDGGAGKTTLAVDIAFALARGESWLDLIVPDRAVNIGVIEAEGPRQEFRDKLEAKLDHHGALCLDGRIVVLEEPWGEFSFADDEQRAELAAYVRDNEIDLLVVGPVVAVGMIGGGTPDEGACV